jgi:hypothetical protein
MTIVDGSTLVGVPATTHWTLRNRVTEAKRTGNELDDPWTVKLFGCGGPDGRIADQLLAAGPRGDETYQMDLSS